MLVLNLPAFENKKYTAYDHFMAKCPDQERTLIYLMTTWPYNKGHYARLKKTNIYFAIELSLREISFVVYAHALICAR